MRAPFVLCILACVFVSGYCLDASWKLVFSDEFNGTAVDTNKWNVRNKPGNWGYGTTPDELQHYDPSAITVSNGNLVITASKDPTYWNQVQPYKSGWMDSQSKFYTSYARYEFRAKMPAGNGMWPALWLLSEQQCWPLGAEIDIMEYRATYPNDVNGFYHYAADCASSPGQLGSRRDYISSFNLAQDFHVYAVEWSPSNISWFFDGILIRTALPQNLGMGLTQFDPTTHYIIINSAVSGGNDFAGNVDQSTVFPNSLYIDYVRVYHQACTSCSNHGCCDPNTFICNCNAGWSGASCEQYTGSFVDQFTSYHYEYSPTKDIKINGWDNGYTFYSDTSTVLNNGLTITLTNASCPGSCGGKGYLGGGWSSGTQFSYGTFTFVAKGTNIYGTALSLQASNQGAVSETIEILLKGATPTSAALTTWHGNTQQYQTTIALGFDASAGFHNYSCTYGAGFVLFYVDNKLVYNATQNTPSGLLYMAAYYSAQPDWFGSPFVYTKPSTVQVSLASWAITPTTAKCSAPPPPTPAPTCSPSPVGTGTGLTGDYFDGDTDSSWFVNYKQTVVDPTINFSWGDAAPLANVNAEYFSVRWTGQVQPRYTGTYAFYSTSDDGVRLYVNGILVIDYWMPQSPTERSGTISLQGGVKYDIVLEYEDTTYEATQILSWSSNCQAKQVIPQSQLYPCRSSQNAKGNGLTGKYYSDMNLQTLVRTQIDPKVNFNWGTGGPAALNGQVDQFSISWSGIVQPRYSGAYTFYASSDDGDRVYVNGQLIINAWRDQSLTETSGTIALVGGRNYTVVYQYYENTVDAQADFYWSNACEAKQIIPQSQLFSA